MTRVNKDIPFFFHFKIMIYLRPVTSKEKNMPHLKHLSGRNLDRVKRNLSSHELCDVQILTSSSDLGVVRNGGRRGSNFGPQAILSNVLKLASHQSIKKFAINEVSGNSFDQETDAKNIARYLKNKGPIIHIGGGHDHIYPFLKAINQNYKKITVINIDPHLDTRMDKTFHSGTPFRQFSEVVEGDFHLIQFGFHNFTNPDSNLTPLPNGKMDIISFEEIKNETKNFSLPVKKLLEKYLEKKFEADHALVLSLDCDALHAGIMEGVSAVNHEGLPLYVVEEILNQLRPNYFGIYEYNPVYDNLSEKGARALASLIYKILD
jgi:formiminoglutamase